MVFFTAIHQFLLEVHINAWGLDRAYRAALQSLEIQTDFIRDDLFIDSNQQNGFKHNGGGDENDEHDVTTKLYAPYNGQYDNLFFFFTMFYQLIHYHYDHNKLLAYKRPIVWKKYRKSLRFWSDCSFSCLFLLFVELSAVTFGQ